MFWGGGSLIQSKLVEKCLTEIRNWFSNFAIPGCCHACGVKKAILIFILVGFYFFQFLQHQNGFRDYGWAQTVVWESLSLKDNLRKKDLWNIKVYYYKIESESIGFCLGIGFRSIFEIPFMALYCGGYGQLTQKKCKSLYLPSSLYFPCILWKLVGQSNYFSSFLNISSVYLV